MPIYEYEPVDRECAICNGRVEVIQAIDEPPCEFCPWCGMSVRKVVSRPSVKVSRKVDPDTAAKKGFSTFRKVEKGKWEKVAGPDNPTPPEEAEE